MLFIEHCLESGSHPSFGDAQTLSGILFLHVLEKGASELTPNRPSKRIVSVRLMNSVLKSPMKKSPPQLNLGLVASQYSDLLESECQYRANPTTIPAYTRRIIAQLQEMYNTRPDIIKICRNMRQEKLT